MNKPINEVSQKDVAAFCESVLVNDNFIDLYQRLATRSAIYPGQGTPFGLMYAALGLAEAGEVQNKVKKVFRDDNVLSFFTACVTHDAWVDHIPSYSTKPISEERKQQLAKELGGVLWYIAACCNELGLEMSAVAATNLRELADRAARGTLGGDGDNR